MITKPKQFEIERILCEISKTILRLNNETYFNVSKNADIAMAKLFIWCLWSINIRESVNLWERIYDLDQFKKSLDEYLQNFLKEISSYKTFDGDKEWKKCLMFILNVRSDLIKIGNKFLKKHKNFNKFF